MRIKKLVLCLRAAFSAPPDKIAALWKSGAIILTWKPRLYIFFESCDLKYIKLRILQPIL